MMLQFPQKLTEIRKLEQNLREAHGQNFPQGHNR